MTEHTNPETWSALLLPENRALVEAAAASAPGDMNALARLREKFPRALVEAAFSLTAGRRKAAAKFDHAARLLCDPEGVEQASGSRVAGHKARRFAGNRTVVDVCAGIGGDAMEIARQASSLRAVDSAGFRCVMVRHNAAVEATEAEAATVRLGSEDLLHIDPSRRRAGGRRLWSYEDYEPGPEVVEALLAQAAGGGVKLGPGIDWRDLPDLEHRELEFIGDGRSLTQAVLWTGVLAGSPGRNTATRLLSDDQALSFSARGDGGELYVEATPRRFLFVPDPALERAGLLAARAEEADEGAGLAELAPGLGVLTGDLALGDPWFEEHEILASMPWRPGKIRAWLKAHDGGQVVVRTRASAVPTDRNQLALRGSGGTAYVLFGLRLDKRVVCFITRPVC